MVVTAAHWVSTHASSDPSLPSLWVLQVRGGAFWSHSEQPVLVLAFHSWAQREDLKELALHVLLNRDRQQEGRVWLVSLHLLPCSAVCRQQSE